jgi:hypothetical protein
MTENWMKLIQAYFRIRFGRIEHVREHWRKTR